MKTIKTAFDWTTAVLALSLALTACEPQPETTPDSPDALSIEDAPAAAANELPAESSAPAVEGPGLNLNTATRPQFLTIPAVGDNMVEEFFEYRPYVSIRQFRREIGKYVDAEQVAAYERYVYVPVDPNASDAATLEQLPGVDAEVSAALIAGRPYASDQAFLDALAAHVTEAQASSAEAYLNGS